jgi:iron complex outermembrane receptor protein
VIRTLSLILLFVGWFTSTQAQAPQRGAVSGFVVEEGTSNPVGFASILIIETNRGVMSHENGRFVIGQLMPGTYTFRASRIGYDPFIVVGTVVAGDTLALRFEMAPTVYRSRLIEIVGQRENSGSDVDVDRIIGGRALRQQLSRTLAETMTNEPGMSQSTMGPAPARPVLRGLAGDRLLILEDGRSTGDLSSSSPDHALAIDPMNADRIEIIRGPAALIYSSNTMAGVINVVRGQIPTSLINHAHGTVSLQGESVNSGMSMGANLYGSKGLWAYKVDASGRGAGNIRTPAGILSNTSMRTAHAAVGGSTIRDWGMIGLSMNMLDSRYGIPGDFVGAHPNGVKINMQRMQTDARLELTPKGGFFDQIEHHLTGSYYFHEELEYSNQRQTHDIVGSDFIYSSIRMHSLWNHGTRSWLRRGQLGYSGGLARLTVGGYTFTPPTTETTAAIYGFEDVHFGMWTLQFSARFDVQSVLPDEQRAARIGLIRSRTFAEPSGAVRLTRTFNSGVEVGVNGMRTVRIPSVKELFSEGPHLPAYSYEVGNPDLGAERGWGGELFARAATERAGLQLSAYINRIEAYLYPRNTGQFAIQRPLPIYQYTGADVVMIGMEALSELRITESVHLSGTASWVEGSIVRTGEPIPFIPPLSGKLNLEYSVKSLTLGAGVRAAAAQNRLGEFEESTDGYLVGDLTAQAHIAKGRILHTVSLKIENVADTEYRMHLSRVKSIMPEPGRNVSLLYRAYF